ncbi:MAG: hypothetical protein ACYDBJ_09270 [Aggregatilineales bacterium]
MNRLAAIISRARIMRHIVRIGAAAFALGILALFGGLSVRGATANTEHFPVGSSPNPTIFSPTPSMAATSTVVTNTPTTTATPTSTETFSSTPTINPRGIAHDVMAGLQAAGVAPAGGRQLFGVPNGYALTSDPGYSFLPLGNGQSARDFVLGFQMGWHSVGLNSACGIRFRGQSTDWRSVMLTADGRLMLTHQIGANLTVNYDQPTTHFSTNSVRNPVIVIAIGNTFTIYLNGQLEAIVTDESSPADSVQSGDMAFEVYNPAGNTAVTDCAYYNLWVWSFDEHLSPTATP